MQILSSGQHLPTSSECTSGDWLDVPRAGIEPKAAVASRLRVVRRSVRSRFSARVFRNAGNSAYYSYK